MDIELKVSFHTGFLFIFLQSILRAILGALHSFCNLGHKMDGEIDKTQERGRERAKTSIYTLCFLTQG